MRRPASDVLRGCLVGLLLLVALALAACGGSASSGPDHPSARPVALNSCLTADEATLSWYDDDSVSAAVGILGSGSAGVVISYEQAGSVCPWLPLARRLADEGLAVLLYERLDDFDPSEYLPAMIGILADQGVDRVSLVGGSIGGMGSITVAAKDPRVVSVVSLSGASQDTVTAAPDLTVPLLLVVARDDQPFSDLATATDQAADASPRHRLVVLDGNAHASVLFSVDASLLDRVVRFVTGSVAG